MSETIIVQPEQPVETVVQEISEADKIAIAEQARQDAEREAEQNRQIEDAKKAADSSMQAVYSRISDMEGMIGGLSERLDTLQQAVDLLAVAQIVEENKPQDTIVEETPPPAAEAPKKRKRGWV
jgi:hypothetical protein